MKETINTPSKLGWLIIPLVFAWLASNYLWTSMKGSKPAWADPPSTQGVVSGVSDTKVNPYYRNFGSLPRSKSGYVTFWFDDAWENQILHGLPVIRRFNLPAALSVPTGMIGYSGYMDWDDIKNLQHQGWEITNHTVTHPDNVSDWPMADVYRELANSQKIMWHQGLTSSHFVSPLSTLTPNLVENARHLFVSLRSSEGGVNPLPLEDRYYLKSISLKYDTKPDILSSYINQAASQNDWLILVFHQIGSEDTSGTPSAEYMISQVRLEQIITEALEKGLVPALPSQIIQ
ncbi:MAG: polysaccharide deacetylase family protein [Candidatus Shapirobacteria bacterium]|jgi:peptidoglycan/xylan/chitin deacetylase (PgdA/CDA1 family)